MRVDYDDPVRDQYAIIQLPENFEMVIGPPDGPKTVPELTENFFKTYPDLKWYGLLGDDVVAKTYGWDTQLIEAAGDWNMAYCHDGINNERHFAHGVIGGELMRCIGSFLVKGCSHFYIDTALFEIGKATGSLRYLPDVRLEHIHFTAFPEELDETYARVRARPEVSRDSIAFNNWLSYEFPQIVQRVLNNRPAL